MLRPTRLFALATVVATLVGCHSMATNQATHELPWSEVHLAGMHLSLVSPKQPGQSLDLRFSEKFVVFGNCDHGYCTGPLTGWKIEGNRLKLGDHQDEGDALIGVSDTMLVLRDKAGKVYTYAIARP